MFDALAMVTHRPEAIPRDGILDLALEHLNCDMSDLMVAQSLSEAMDDLEALRITINTYGFNRAVIGFADHDGSLSRILPQVPSLEAFDP